MGSAGLYRAVAPTGIASLRINGKTVQSFFKLKQNRFSGCSIIEQDLENSLKIRTILWNEISTTDKRQFSRGLQNLRRLCDTAEGTRFRVNIVLFGDFFQLRSVNVAHLFAEPKGKKVGEKSLMAKKSHQDKCFGFNLTKLLY